MTKKLFILFLLLSAIRHPPSALAVTPGDIVINEIMWMGTAASSSDEWIELYNNTDQEIDLTNWTLKSEDGTPLIILASTITAKGYYLLERTDDNTVKDIAADKIYSGALSDTGESLVLYDSYTVVIDSVPCSGGWFAGAKAPNYSMERINPQESGWLTVNWANNNEVMINGQDANGSALLATPRAQNSVFNSGGGGDEGEVINPPSEYKILITEAGFAAAVDWVELYNYGDTAVDIANFMLTDLDGTDTHFAAFPATLMPGKYAVVYWDENGINETDQTGDLNNNGVLDLYVADSSLSATDDQIILMSAASGGQYIDAVCWANQSGGFSSGEENDLLLLSGNGMWKLNGTVPSEADCISSKDITVDQSIGRIMVTAADNDDSSDWRLFKLATPGKDNPELVPPKVILLFDPPPPFTTSQVKVSMIIESSNLIGNEPQVSYSWDLEPAHPVFLTGADKAWTGELTIPVHSEERNIILQYRVEDIAQNIATGEVAALCLAQELPSEPPSEDDNNAVNPAVDHKVRITEVAFAASIDWVELYNYSETAINIADFMLTDLDGTDTRIADQKTTLAPGKYAVVYWDDTGIDETDDTGDVNNNGFIDLYVNDTGLSATDDEIVLLSASSDGQIIDAACWSTGIGELTSSENKDVKLLADNKHWTVAGDTVTKSDCWSNGNKITSEQSIGRLDPTVPDTHSKNDWYLFELPTPGKDNPSPIPPLVTFYFDPEPPFKDGQVKITMCIETLNSIITAPQLSFNEGLDDFQNITLSGADKEWQGIFEISQNEAERNISFKYKVIDQAKNSIEQELMYLGLAYVPPEYGEKMYCSPNPWIMNSGQLLKFSNLGEEEYTIKIFTLQGELIKILNGQGDAYWDGTNENGEKAASGIYVYCMENTQLVKKGKIAILK